MFFYRKYLSSQHQKALKHADYTRDELVRQAQSAYERASKTGGADFASVTSYLSSATNAAKDKSFNSWSRSDLEKYLESYGLKGHRGATIDQLRTEADLNANYFKYGTLQQQASLFSRLQSGVKWFLDQLKIGALSGRAEGEKAADAARARAPKAAKHAEL